MPFVRIDFSSYDSSAALQKTVNGLFERLQKPSRVVCAFLGFRCDYEISKNRLLRSLAALHSCFIALLSVFLFFSLVAHFYLLRYFESAPLAIEIGHVLLYTQGFASYVFLLWWQKNDVGKSFHQTLLHTTSGVGFVKHAADIGRIHACSFVFGSLVAVLIVSRFSLVLFTRALHAESSYLDYSLFSIQFRFCLLLSSLYFALSIPAANALVFGCISVVASEFRALDADFSEDTNTFQVAVAKHYINVHWRISRLWLSLRRPVTIIFSLQIVSHLLTVLLLAISGVHRSEWPYEIAMAVLLASNAIVLLMLVFTFAIVLRNRSTGLQYPMTALIAKERALHDQTYSAICIYSTFLTTASSLGVSFFDLVLIDKAFVFGAAISVLVAVVFHSVYPREEFI